MTALSDLGCDVVQGVLIAEPMGGEKLADWMAKPPWPLEHVQDAA